MLMFYILKHFKLWIFYVQMKTIILLYLNKEYKFLLRFLNSKNWTTLSIYNKTTYNLKHIKSKQWHWCLQNIIIKSLQCSVQKKHSNRHLFLLSKLSIHRRHNRICVERKPTMRLSWRFVRWKRNNSKDNITPWFGQIHIQSLELFKNEFLREIPRHFAKNKSNKGFKEIAFLCFRFYPTVDVSIQF